MKSKKQDKLLFYGFGVGFILVVVALIVGMTNFPVTGAAITVKSYGVSGELISSQSGNLQTLLELKKPVLKNLADPASRQETVKTIGQKVDLTQPIIDLYNKNPATTVSGLTRLGLRVGAKKGNINFVKNLRCFQEIGTFYHGRNSMDFVMVTELKYQACLNKKDWQFAYLKHTFFQEKDHSFFCSQEDDKLFAISNSDGTVTTDLTNC